MSLLRRAAHRAGRLAASAPLAVLYVVGALAAVVAVAAVTCGSAVLLGWSDVRKRAGHGSA